MIERDLSVIEPRVLAVFRLFLGVLLTINLFGQIIESLVFAPDSRFGPGTNVWAFVLFRISWILLLLSYLNWSEVLILLGKLYLPVALTAVSLFIIIERGIALQAHKQNVLLENMTSIQNVVNSAWLTFILMLIPLVIVAWQYNRPILLLFSFATLLVEAGVVSFILEMGDPIWFRALAPSFARTGSMIVIGIVLMQLVDGQRAQRHALSEANAKLRHHALTVEQLSTSQERNRLARELHDVLAHTLSASSVQMEAIDAAWESAPDEARKLLHKIHEQTRTGLTETRRALRALRASPLDDLGLIGAIQVLAETTAQRAGFDLTIHIEEPTTTLAPDVEQSLYRIMQESLQNISKHAGASEVAIQLLDDGGRLVLQISDNGRGFELKDNGFYVDKQDTQEEHFGIRGMRERAELINGTLDIESELEKGTTIRLVVNKEQVNV